MMQRSNAFESLKQRKTQMALTSQPDITCRVIHRHDVVKFVQDYWATHETQVYDILVFNFVEKTSCESWIRITSTYTSLRINESILEGIYITRCHEPLMCIWQLYNILLENISNFTVALFEIKKIPKGNSFVILT